MQSLRGREKTWGGICMAILIPKGRAEPVPPVQHLPSPVNSLRTTASPSLLFSQITRICSLDLSTQGAHSWEVRERFRQGQADSTLSVDSLSWGTPPARRSVRAITFSPEVW